MSSDKNILSNIKNRYLSLRIIETALFTLGISFLSITLTAIFTSATFFLATVGLVTGAAVVAIRIIRLQLLKFDELRVAIFLNQHYPQLEASADLLVLKNDLSSLQQIQKESIYKKLASIEKDIRLPHHLVSSAVMATLCVSLWVFVNLKLPVLDKSKVVEQSTISSKLGKIVPYTPVGLSKINLTINSPVYTKVLTSTTNNPNVKLIEGGSLKWKINFSGDPIDPSIVLSGKGTINLKNDSGSFTFSRSFTDEAFYQITWSDSTKKNYQTDFYSIEIIKDEAPHITVENLPQFIELKLSERMTVDLKANLTDDFGLSDAHIIATVSKGSGESVKFREEILRFTNPTQISGKQQQASRLIDLVKLGLEPGDELYFYIEAFDNKVPKVNKSRTETFFIDVQDTTTYEEVADEGLGVDLMPEYFRSQRQIIIDSEKLLAERKAKKVKKEDFNFRSNELGYDQKVLRLRYGQFMGEEFEQGIGTETAAQHAGGEEHKDEDEDPLKKFGHEHDTENEHNLVPDKKGVATTGHEHEKKEGEQENPLEAFAHSHDNTDEASFFVQSVRTKLKAALTLMWDAELHLRMYQPETSLPYQYKILKLLKEISNDSRVYVHRTGFDPPPIKEEKRLSGDLSELKNSSNKNKASTGLKYPAIRKGLVTIESLLENNNNTLTEVDKTDLQLAGNELASVALKQPGTYLKSLSLLKSVINNEVEQTEMKSALIEVRQSFWKILPTESVSPSAKQTTKHALDDQFLQQLEEIK
jgi:hypothetical protein